MKILLNCNKNTGNKSQGSTLVPDMLCCPLLKFPMQGRQSTPGAVGVPLKSRNLVIKELPCKICNPFMPGNPGFPLSDLTKFWQKFKKIVTNQEFQYIFERRAKIHSRLCLLTKIWKDIVEDDD